MAQPQTFTAPDGKQIELTWATDEVLREILDVLNKDKKGDTKSQKANKKVITENLTPDDISIIRAVIRKEVAKIFFDLYRKKSTWSN